MILFELMCSDGHRFEAWFLNGAAFEDQRDGKAISCPMCGDRSITKAPMAPRVLRSGGVEGTEPSDAMTETMSALVKVRRHIEETFDYVGPTFAEEARRIHYGETEHRDIYGETTPDEANTLRDEGITVHSIPWVSRRDD